MANWATPLLIVTPPVKVFALLNDTIPVPVVLTTTESVLPVPWLTMPNKSMLKLFEAVDKPLTVPELPLPSSVKVTAPRFAAVVKVPAFSPAVVLAVT